MSASERQKGLAGIVPSGSPILLNLLSVLSENGRLAAAPRVFADFHSLMAAYRGELEVIVTSAEALDSKSMQRLEKALKVAQLAEGKTLKINNRVGQDLDWQGLGRSVRANSVSTGRKADGNSRSTPPFSVVFSSTSETRQVSLPTSLHVVKAPRIAKC